MKCEHCGKEHDGNYGSGRFCSYDCCHAFIQQRKILSMKKRKVKIGQDRLDIDYLYLDEYREQHPVCEICGNEEIIKDPRTGKINRLTVDHDHKTMKFRGLVCHACNTKLGWFDKYRDNILNYTEE